MGIFSTGNDRIEGDLKNTGELLEAMIYDEISRLSDEKKQEFVNSEAAQVMVEAGLIGKKTLVKLSKEDDLSRRIQMASLQIAKDNDDVLYSKLVKIRMQERELLSKISNKFENKATKAARIGQKDYLKNKIPVGYMRK